VYDAERVQGIDLAVDEEGEEEEEEEGQSQAKDSGVGGVSLGSRALSVFAASV